MTNKDDSLVPTDHEMLKALYDKFIVEGEEPKPPGPGPDPGRSPSIVAVTVAKCHLRFISHFDGAGKAVWGSYPKGSDNPKRDRYLIYFNQPVQVYMDGNIKYGKYKGAIKATGNNHGWEVVPRQIFNSHPVTGNPKLFILCRDTKRT